MIHLLSGHCCSLIPKTLIHERWHDDDSNEDNFKYDDVDNATCCVKVPSLILHRSSSFMSLVQHAPIVESETTNDMLQTG